MGFSQMVSALSWSFFCIHAAILLSYHRAQGHGSTIGRNVTDQFALLEFKAKITDDPFEALSSWNNSVHFCDWYGVTCGRQGRRVTVLDLQSLKLVGSISPHIGNLSFLTALELQDNGFSDKIPSEIGLLPRLQVLRLHNNSLRGEIPANISSCSNLIDINVGFNQLTGKIPVELGFLLKLESISIHGNSLTGSIPSSLGNLSSLEIFSATQNNLDGSLPYALGGLTQLTGIALGQNKLTGTIHPSFFNLSSITTFDVGGNEIYGILPSDLGITLPNLQFLGLGMNQFTGPFPVSISNASNMQVLIFTANQFTGKVPNLEKLHMLSWLSISSNHLGSGGKDDDLNFLHTLTNATNLELVTINDNSFGGILPESIGNLSTNLAVLLLDNNQILGSIPPEIENLVNLERLEVWNNQLSGTIPPTIGNLQKLQILIFNQNFLSGNVPDSLGNLTKLTRLHLARNNLQGSIPSSLGNCQNLLTLDLSTNNLTGAIPPQVIGLSSLSIYLGLQQNHLTGSLPLEVGNLKNLGEFDVSENSLSSEIPSTLGSCVRLELLYMESNSFQGPIPSSLSSLRGIRVLDLSRNNLSGQIPEFLAGFGSLQNLNLSYNDFEGPVPTEGVFSNSNVTLVMGNSKLCGGIPEFHLPECKTKKPGKSGLTFVLKIIIGVVCGLLGVILVCSFLFLCWFRKKRKEPTPNNLENSLLRLSYQSLHKATGGFSSSNWIGGGGFGSVYKGILETDGTTIAVKVLNLKHRGASKSFIAECEALKNIRHRNLVKVLTTCSSVDFQGNDFKALVYEYMINGSLEEWLHPILQIDEANEAPRNLTVLQRINIAIDVACALDYLHNQCQPPVVHCDLKPSNVLLDEEMTGHVGDFGLARIHPEATNNCSTSQSSSIGVRGTIGYAPPEYGMGSEVSMYGDMYSYGIVLLEIFTGKRPTDDIFSDDLNLSNFVKENLPERVTETVDPILLQERDREASTSNNIYNQIRMRNSRGVEGLISVLGIGVACSAELPAERMSASDVVAQLSSIRDKLVGTVGG